MCLLFRYHANSGIMKVSPSSIEIIWRLIPNLIFWCIASYFVKIIWYSNWFCKPPLFETAYCFICGCLRMAVARYRMIFLVLVSISTSVFHKNILLLLQWVYRNFKLGYIYQGMNEESILSKFLLNTGFLSLQITITSGLSCLLCSLNYHNHSFIYFYSGNEN